MGGQAPAQASLLPCCRPPGLPSRSACARGLESCAILEVPFGDPSAIPGAQELLQSPILCLGGGFGAREDSQAGFRSRLGRCGVPRPLLWGPPPAPTAFPAFAPNSEVSMMAQRNQTSPSKPHPAHRPSPRVAGPGLPSSDPCPGPLGQAPFSAVSSAPGGSKRSAREGSRSAPSCSPASLGARHLANGGPS